jgi:hypothetical protein
MRPKVTIKAESHDDVVLGMIKGMAWNSMMRLRAGESLDSECLNLKMYFRYLFKDISDDYAIKNTSLGVVFGGLKVEGHLYEIVAGRSSYSVYVDSVYEGVYEYETQN